MSNAWALDHTRPWNESIRWDDSQQHKVMWLRDQKHDGKEHLVLLYDYGIEMTESKIELNNVISRLNQRVFCNMWVVVTLQSDQWCQVRGTAPSGAAQQPQICLHVEWSLWEHLYNKEFLFLSPLSSLDQNTNLGNSVWCHAQRNATYFLACQSLNSGLYYPKKKDWMQSARSFFSVSNKHASIAVASRCYAEAVALQCLLLIGNV